MIHKENYGFNTFGATRVEESQEGTNVDDWYWIPSQYNAADWLTRGKSPFELKNNSIWQNGPEFLEHPEAEWPVNRSIVMHAITHSKDGKHKDSLAMRINIDRFSSYTKLLKVTVRVLAMCKKRPKPSFKNIAVSLTPEDIANAEIFWIFEVQRKIKGDIMKGRYKLLCPRQRADGIYVVGHRVRNWVEMSYNKSEIVLLPYAHPFSRLYAEHIHQKGHLEVSATTSKIRTKFWIIKLQLNPGDSNCQRKLKLLRVIRVSSYRDFEQKDQKHLIKVLLCLYMFYCKIFSNVRA